MSDIKHYLYSNNKTIAYNYKLLQTNDIFLSRNEYTATIKINNVSITLPKEKFTKILNNKGGVVTFKKNQLRINKLKSSSNIDITIRDKQGNFESSIIYSPHFNTPDWHQFKCFIEGKTPLMILSLCKPQTQYDKTIKTSIGIGIYPLNIDANTPNEAMDLTSSGGYFETVDRYSFEFDLESQYSPKLLISLKEQIEEYLEECSEPILVQNLNEIEKVLNFKIPRDRIYNFDDLISFDDFESTRTHHISKDLMVYGDSPHQLALTLSQLYFDKVILNNTENKLDKLIENVKIIENMDPILHFDI